MATTLPGPMPRTQPQARAITLPPSIPLKPMALIMTLTVLIAWFSTWRITHAGDWLPTVPNQIGAWTAIDTPLPPETLRLLGGPQALGRVYTNEFKEMVQVSLIAANGFDAYHEPTVCVSNNGFALTAVKTFKIDGPGSGDVRAMIFKRSDPEYGEQRMMMYYWQQNRDGTTATDAVMGNYRDIMARFHTGAGAVFLGHQTCMVRIFAPVDPGDRNGEQTQRNLTELARAIYHSMKKSGAED